MSAGQVPHMIPVWRRPSFWVCCFSATAALLMFVAEGRIIERDQQLRARTRAKAIARAAQVQEQGPQREELDRVANVDRPPVGYRILRVALIAVAAVSYVVLLVSRFRQARRREASS